MRDSDDLDLSELRQVVARACGALKIFPLPDAVVLPGTPTPFHVFEPRYCALVKDALEGDRVLAVPTLVAPEGAMQEHAAVHPVAGVGVIEAEERLPDGRYRMVVRGVARVRLLLDAELERGRPYRELPAELLEDRYPPGGAAALLQQRAALQECTLRLAEVLPPESGAPRLAEIAARLESPSQLADLVAAAVVSDTDQRLAVLEELDVARRLDLVTGEVASVVLMLSQGRSASA